MHLTPVEHFDTDDLPRLGYQTLPLGRRIGKITARNVKHLSKPHRTPVRNLDGFVDQTGPMSIRMVFPHMYNDSSGKHMCVQTFRSVRRDVKNIVPSAVRTDSVLNDQTSPRGKFRDRNRWEPCGTN